MGILEAAFYTLLLSHYKNFLAKIFIFTYYICYIFYFIFCYRGLP